LLIDLHTHSYPMSDDSFMSVDELIEGAREAGLDGICLTDHDAFWPEERVRELSQRHEFLVLAGSEINTDAGHVLAFGLHRYEFGMHKPEFLRACADRDQGILVAAHPYRRRFLADPGRQPQARAEMLERAVSDDFFPLCDAIEGINGRGLPAENDFSRDLGTAVGLKFTGGSDAHRLEQLGTVATRFERPVRCLADLIQEIKGGRFQPEVLAGGLE
jgi:predicted metal-dependent phosphoesterase TrpH